MFFIIGFLGFSYHGAILVFTLHDQVLKFLVDDLLD